MSIWRLQIYFVIRRMKWTRWRWIFFLVLLAVIGLIGIRFWSYFLSAIPLGYDHGLYRAFFLTLQQQLPYLHFSQLPLWMQATYEPLSGLLSIVIHSIAWISPDGLLLCWVAFLHILISLFIYLVLRKYNKVTALLGVLLYLTSIIQYQVFWRWYLKQMLGVLFILTAYYLIEKKSYWLLIPILTALFTVNRAGWLFFLLSYFLYKLVVYIKHKSRTWNDVWSLLIAAGLSIVVYRPLMMVQIFDFFSPMFGQAFLGEASGTFFDKPTYMTYNIILITLSIFWCIVWRARSFIKKIPLELIGFAIGILWVWCQLFFYNRMLWYFDIFVIILAAYGLSFLLLHSKKIWKLLGIWLYLLQLTFFIFYVWRTHFPLMIDKEFATIQEIPSLIKTDAKIMVTGRKYSSFLMWYASRTIMAPWLFDWDPWTATEWTTWHLSDGVMKCQMLNLLDIQARPQYLWIWSLQPLEQLSGATCLQKLRWDDSYWFYLVKYGHAKDTN